MPYPSQITPDSILAQARELLEAQGSEALSLHALAAALGVRAPSLYRYFAGKAELLRALNLDTNRALVNAMHQSASEGDSPAAGLLAMARAYRAYAHAHPQAYALAYAPAPADQRADPAALQALALPLQAEMARLVADPTEALAALRGLWALVHGFVLLEIGAQFQRGGDLTAAFDFAVQAYLTGCAV